MKLIELLDEAQQPSKIAPYVDALTKHISQFVLNNARAVWEANPKDHASLGDFKTWLVRYYLPSQHVDNVINNVSRKMVDDVKQQVAASVG